MLAESLRTLARRWRLVVIFTIVDVAIAVGLSFAVPPTQLSTSAVLLVPSVYQPGVSGPTNPLLALGGSVAVVASVVQIAVNDDETVLKLVDEGYTGKYQVSPNLSENAGPILMIKVEHPSAAMAQRTMKAVSDEISARLKALQDQRSVPANLRVTAEMLTASPKPLPQHKKQIQTCVAAGAGLLALQLLFILLLERRRRPKTHTVRPDRGVASAGPDSEALDNSDRPGGRHVGPGTLEPGVTSDESQPATTDDASGDGDQVLSGAQPRR